MRTVYILIVLGDHRDLPQPWTLYATYLKHCKVHRKTQFLVKDLGQKGRQRKYDHSFSKKSTSIHFKSQNEKKNEHFFAAIFADQFFICQVRFVKFPIII